MRRKNKKKTLYKKSLLVFFIILLISTLLALTYVYKTMIAYEKGDIDTYLNSLLNDIEKQARYGNIDKYLSLTEQKNSYEKNSSLKKGYKELISNNNLSYKKTSKDNTYDIYAGDKILATVTLKTLKTEHRLGLLTYEVWDIDNIVTYNEEGLYHLDFYIASGNTLYINGILAKDEDLIEKSKIDELEEGYDFIDLPTLNHYKIKNLTYKPEIVIKDKDNKEVSYEIKDDAIYATNFYNTNDEAKALEKLNHSFDTLAFAKNWSLFLSRDLHGQSYGLSTLSTNLIKDTGMCKKARDWATGVDITFISRHTLANDTFTNTKVSNFTIYNDSAFSAEVYLEKNMFVSGRAQVDVLHDKLYFIYYDGAYRLITLKSVTE